MERELETLIKLQFKLDYSLQIAICVVRGRFRASHI